MLGSSLYHTYMCRVGVVFSRKYQTCLWIRHLLQQTFSFLNVTDCCSSAAKNHHLKVLEIFGDPQRGSK
ncbi:hypothetical protein XELAEV_18018941mg [Xenopus laevis]|uniref:Uncharacterized protein n=1 Tax=Xenopus laevis TaxID=8355 RepID=A0A974DE33_XENLA|nr:hypothetical protein XELAEV_18018941mg [Xenopus laevis]